MSLRVGDVITVRTAVSRRKMRGVVKYVNYKFGWYTVEFKTSSGKFRESFFIRELHEDNKVDGRKSRWQEDNPDYWLSEWSDLEGD